jgi:hypothetical protein
MKTFMDYIILFHLSLKNVIFQMKFKFLYWISSDVIMN